MDSSNESNETILLKEQISQLESDVKFYKSILEMRNSCIFNLHEKTKNGKRVWIDIINTDKNELLELDLDDEIKEWLKPIRCEK